MTTYAVENNSMVRRVERLLTQDMPRWLIAEKLDLPLSVVAKVERLWLALGYRPKPETFPEAQRPRCDEW